MDILNQLKTRFDSQFIHQYGPDEMARKAHDEIVRLREIEDAARQLIQERTDYDRKMIGISHTGHVSDLRTIRALLKG